MSCRHEVVDGTVFLTATALTYSCMFCERERSHEDLARTRLVLADLVALVKRQNGFMTAEEQAVLWRAEWEVGT